MGTMNHLLQGLVRPLCCLDPMLVSVNEACGLRRTVCQRISDDLQGRDIGLNSSRSESW